MPARLAGLLPDATKWRSRDITKRLTRSRRPRVLQWMINRGGPAVAPVIRPTSMNPYSPPEVQLQPLLTHRHHWLAFASTATVVFGVASWIDHSLRADPRPFIATPTQFAVSYLPFFAFSGMVGAVNLFSPTRGYFLRSPVSVRMIAAVLLGSAPIPLDIAIVNYLGYVHLLVPFRVAETAVVVLGPVVLSTAAERLLLKFGRPEMAILATNWK